MLGPGIRAVLCFPRERLPQRLIHLSQTLCTGGFAEPLFPAVSFETAHERSQEDRTAGHDENLSGCLLPPLTWRWAQSGQVHGSPPPDCDREPVFLVLFFVLEHRQSPANAPAFADTLDVV
jgi:hypothetical protein